MRRHELAVPVEYPIGESVCARVRDGRGRNERQRKQGKRHDRHQRERCNGVAIHETVIDPNMCAFSSVYARTTSAPFERVTSAVPPATNSP